jgi:glucokinase
MILAGDIGATKSILGIFAPARGARDPLAMDTLRTGDYPDLETLVSTFLKRTGAQVTEGCLGIAAPVTNGEARMINTPWVVRQEELREKLGLSSLRLMNDLQAIAYSIPLLVPGDYETINDRSGAAGGGLAVIAPGTGLGEAFLTWDGTRYRGHASEGGHVDFAPRTPLEAELLRELQNRFGHVSYERICSGPGIYNIYSFLKKSGYAEGRREAAAEISAAEDPAPAIIRAALDPVSPCGLCMLVLDVFISVLGAEAGNLALKVLATGGVYIAGGIPPRIISLLKKGGFMKSFGDKGRESFLLSRMPVRVILNTESALIGAAAEALEGQRTKLRS